MQVAMQRLCGLSTLQEHSQCLPAGVGTDSFQARVLSGQVPSVLRRMAVGWPCRRHVGGVHQQVLLQG